MTSPLQLVKRPLHIREREADPDVRGFHTEDRAKARRLRTIGLSFIDGYNLALDTPPAALAGVLDAIEGEQRGFAYEGAGMALALLDAFTLRPHRLAGFLAGPGRRHVYMVHVGAGWALARLRRRLHRPLGRLDPLLGWLAVDGYGFHEGYFRWPRSIERGHRPRHLSGPAGRVFDQGLGRSVWFVRGADVERVAATVVAFDPERHPDLWAGVGLAAAYAGGVDPGELVALRDIAGEHAADLAQGAAFAAQARQRAGNPAPHTDAACLVLCELDAGAAAAATDDALAAVPPALGAGRYEAWRAGIRRALTREPVT